MTLVLRVKVSLRVGVPPLRSDGHLFKKEEFLS